MTAEDDLGFFDWILKNKEWRADYLHKVGFRAIGLCISRQGSGARKEE